MHRDLVREEHVDQHRRAMMFHITGAALLFASGGRLRVSWAAEVAQIASDDPRLRTERVEVDNHAGGLQSYSARPASSTAPRGSVLVIHDILGLTPHFENVARRFAVEGFGVLAPDYASRYGGTPAERGPAIEVVGMATWPEMIADTQAALAWLRAQEGANGKIAAAGYGLGASALGRAVSQAPDLAAAVLLYGRVPPLDQLEGVKAPLLLIYAGDDPAVDGDVPSYVDALKKAGLIPEVVTFPGVQHGFDDETASTRYAPEAAGFAWTKTVEFIRPKIT
jgi:carboxymethylenebutenolidase